MHSNRTLSSEDLALLPSFAKAFGCGDVGLSDICISVTPPFLQFTHDQPAGHLAKVTVWNKGHSFLQVKVEQPNDSNLFHAFCDKKSVFGGAQVTLLVKCTPGTRKLAFDCLRIRLITIDGTEKQVISLPLQLCPGFSWFSIPKVVVMPSVSVGNVAEVSISLPHVPEPEKFFVAIRISNPQPYLTEALSITPLAGVLGNDPNSVSELVIRYSPKQYTTLVHVIEIHFPGVDTVPHEIVIFARATPGMESECVMRETAVLQNYMAMANSNKAAADRKIPEPKLKFKPPSEEDLYDYHAGQINGNKDLTTPAGVMHFLLRKGGRVHENAKTIGPLGLTTSQEQKLYFELEKNFKSSINKEKIRQRNIPLQNTQSSLGEDPVLNRSKIAEKIIRERNQQRSLYEHEIGLNDEEEDLHRTKLMVSNQRSLRRVGEEFIGKPDLDETQIAEIEEEGRRITNSLALIRFVQATYVLMERYRVSKRIPKLRTLIHDLKAAKEAIRVEEEQNSSKVSKG